MAVTAEEVVVKLRADLVEYDRRISSSTRITEQAFDKLGRSAEATSRRTSLAMGSLASVIAAVSVADLAQGFLKIADTAKQMEAQLKLATAGFGSFGQAQADTRRIADATRGSLEATSSLYGNFIRSARETGRTQAEAARATETFAKALKLGGAGAAEAASATLQFGQALASGVLRGDEFNSLAEASPRLLRLLADAIGVPIGQLRALAEQGKLTSAVLFDALLNGKVTAPLDAEIKQLPKTFSDAMTALSNAAIITFGAFDKGGEFSTALANFVSGGADGFRDLEKAAGDLGISIRSTLEGLSDAFAPLEASGMNAADAISDRWKGLRNEIAEVLGLIDNIRNFGRDFPSLIGPDDGVIGRALAPYMKKAPASDMRGRFLKGFDEADKRLQSARTRREIEAIGVGFDSQGFNIGGLTPAPSRPTPASGSAGKKGRASRSTGKADPTSDDLVSASIQRINETGIAEMLAAKEAAENAARMLYDLVGQDPFAGLREGVDKGTYRTEGSTRRTDAEIEANEKVASDYRERMEDQVRTLADLYEDAFIGGTGNIFDNFKRIGLRVVAEVLAKFTAAQINGGGFNLGGALSSAVGSFLPGFANGGSPPVNRPSIVGERGPEIFIPRTAGTIVPNHALGRSMGQPTVVQPVIQVDARGAVMNDQFARMILNQAAAHANRTAAAMGKGVLQAVPSRLNEYNNNGT